ncbi:hypothetical protein [Haloarchaeobius sp. HRN-SO-5]|uniref:hypothetical protein n=1 Tax=Haloarchaeobius sp. HRN-SO-5 TaxID=3446118 RepID=UPI003EBA69FB
MVGKRDDGVPVLSRVADGVERVVFADWYRWFVRGLLLVVAVLAVVHLVRAATADVLVFSTAGEQALDLVTSVVVTVFVLAGAVQLLVLARGVRRREGLVAASAEDVEKSAEDVERAAKELEAAVERDDEEPPAELEERVERAEEQAGDAKETAAEVTDDLTPPADAGDDGTDDEDGPDEER